MFDSLIMLSDLGLVISALFFYPASAEVSPQGAHTPCRQCQVAAHTMLPGMVLPGMLETVYKPESSSFFYFLLNLIPAVILRTQLELAKSWASIPGTNENPAGIRARVLSCEGCPREPLM